MDDEVFGQLGAGGPLDAAAVETRVEELLAAMTLDEKVKALSGDGPALRGNLEMARRYNGTPIVAGAVPRLGIPGIRFSDGPRGVVMYRSTAFPVPMARGATFDPELEERIGDAIGVEARAQGANLFAGVCINLLRHPRWGRAQETYGEDPHLLGEMGAALVRGAQRHVMACVKHFAANSMENSRFWVDVRVDDATLRDIYLPHFRRCVEAGAASVMSAYNQVNGEWCGHHGYLLGKILKEEWKFEGFVMSDFTFGVRECAAAVNGGQDLEMPFLWRFKPLRRLVEQGVVSRERLDDAVRRLLRMQVRFAQRGEPDRYRREAVAGAEHRALAREAARKSIVLLRNEEIRWSDGDGAPLLPLDERRVRRLAVIGKLAAARNLGDLGSSRVRPPSTVTLLDGIKAAAAARGMAVEIDDGERPAGAAALAASCDAVLVVAGSGARDEGEWIGVTGGDRRSLRLQLREERLIARVARANPRTGVVLMGGSAFETEAWIGSVSALVMVWFPGMEGGHAAADVLFGDHPPGGRLPCTWARAESQLPPFRRFARRVEYGPLHGYRMMEAKSSLPAFPFGFGLGYTTTTLDGHRIAEVAGAAEGARRVTVAVEVANTGTRAGVEVIQVYVPEALGSDAGPLRTLRGFQRVELAPGERRTVAVTVQVPPAAERIWVGTSSSEDDLVPLAVGG